MLWHGSQEGHYLQAGDIIHLPEVLIFFAKWKRSILYNFMRDEDYKYFIFQ